MNKVSKILFIAAVFSTIVLFGFKVQNYSEMKNFLMWKNAYGSSSSSNNDYLNDRALEESTKYFEQKMDICLKLEALGVLEEEIPKEYEDLVTPEIHEDCRDFLYN